MTCEMKVIQNHYDGLRDDLVARCGDDLQLKIGAIKVFRESYDAHRDQYGSLASLIINNPTAYKEGMLQRYDFMYHEALRFIEEHEA